MPLYQIPKQASFKNGHRGRHIYAESMFPDFQDLAIRTMYEVEDRLKLAEQSIAEKINEFEMEVGDGAVHGPVTGYALPVGYEPRKRSRSLSLAKDYPERGFATTSAVDPSAVKDLAVRALNAIDKRLRAAERTIDQTIHNFDEMDGSVRAVKAPFRDVASQTPKREATEYESDTDGSQRYTRISD